MNHVSGVVTLGDSPLASAKLLFGGSGGAEKIRAVTDADGHFETSLPHRGTWIVDIDAPQDAVAATTAVEITKPEVEIALPSTAVSGSVDANGQQLGGARVLLFSGDRPMMRVTDADGTFRFRGVRAGPVRLRASDPRTHDYSKDVEVTVPDDGELPNVRLSLESVQSQKGIVRSDGDVVVGAIVHGYAFLGGIAQQQQTTTDIQGRFSFDVPSSVSQATVVVGAPGRTLESFTIATGDEVTLNLSARGGALDLQWKPGDLPLRFAYNDVLLPSPEVFTWARAQGATIGDGKGEIPNVAPGKYRFCSSSHCVEGLLPVGGVLRLDATH